MATGLKGDRLKNIRLLALACSVAALLVAGPFMGYFFAVFLVDKMKFPPLTTPISVFIGLIAAFYSVFLTINKINRS